MTAQPIISEFMASNGGALRDADDNSPDWIEIYNAGDETANLRDFYLSDNADDLDKWRFPVGTTLDAGSYLVVFASGLNEPDSNGNLHTNFRLGSNGEHIVLSTGNQPVSEFGVDGSDYPKQFRDVSYGIGDVVPTNTLIDGSSATQIHVPTSDSLGTSWTEPAFAVDDAWAVGGNGVGYEPGSGGTVLQLDFNDDDSGESGSADVEDGWQSFTLNDNGANYGGVTVTVSDIGGIPLDDRDRTTPTDDPPAFTYDQIYDDFLFARSQTDGTGLEIAVDGLAAGQTYDVTLWSYDTGSVGGRVSNWNEVSSGIPVSIEGNYSFDGTDTPNSNMSHSFTARLVASDTGTLQIQGVRNGGTSFGVFVNAMQIVSPTAAELIATDLSAELAGRSSAFIRYPFNVEAAADVESLSLNVHYDAGFVAYLNGSEVARRNVSTEPGVAPPFDSVGRREKNVDETNVAETIDLSAQAPLLLDGDNVLAIHGINSAVGEEDFVIRAELSATGAAGLPLYFEDSTPGAANSTQGFLGFTADTTFSIDRGFYNEPFDVEITSSTPGASIVYTTDGSLPTSTNGTVVNAENLQASPSASVRVETTSYVRAVAVKDGFLPSNVDTQTYIFLEDVIQQDPTNDPNGPDYPARWQANAEGDYEIDSEVVAQWDDNNPDNEDFGIRDALTSIPTMSIVMDHDDLWATTDGIYRNSDRRGERFRRPASIEYFDPATGEQFQVNAGVQAHGGASRDNVRLKKHSLRILFRSDFGDSTLNFPLFNDTDNTEFNTLVMRAFFTDAFATRSVTDRYNPIESQYLRDVWMKDTQLAMGNLSAHNTYVHLYLNGLYWGLYNPAERPDDAFLSTYLGGEREDWDIVKDFNELFAGSKTAWNDMFRLARELPGSPDPDAIFYSLQGQNPDGTPNGELPHYLDMENFIDYMILHLYAGVEDWPHHNWYAGRNRVDGDGFKFFVWDQEIAVDPRFRDRTDVADRFTPAELYDLLRRNSSEFRLLFADRVQKHLSNDGALTTENAQARWMARADEIEKAIIAESARWGDAREGERIRIQTGEPTVTVPTMTVNEWRVERDKVHNIYFAEDHRLLLERLGNIALIGELASPMFGQPSGVVAAGTDVSILAPQDPLLVETVLMPEFSPVTAHVPRNGNLDANDVNTSPAWTVPSFDDTGWLSGVGGIGFDSRDDYVPLMGIDLLADDLPAGQGMDADGDGANDAVTFYARFPVAVDPNFDASAFDRMTLKMKYDDGFAAYLNGTLVASQNADELPTWDARATASHEANVGTFEEFDISQHMSLLRPGQPNVLAVHAINRSLTSSDFVISPELALGAFQDVGNAPVYITTDGSDPRLPGGMLNPNATLVTEPLAINASAEIRARAKVNDIWSAETSALFVVDNPNLAITEIHYNPADPTLAEIELVPAADSDHFEFLELHNTHPTDSINLLGLKLSNGVDFEFGDDVLQPGEYAVVVSNSVLFEARYGDQIRVLGQWEGNLANNGERIALTNTDDVALFDFRYNDAAPWPAAADGDGESLELISTATAASDYAKAFRWQASGSQGGTPGAANSQPTGLSPDFNADGTVDIADLDMLCAAVVDDENRFDLNGDGKTDHADVADMLANELATVIGDVNFDGVFDSADLVQLFQIQEFEDGIEGNSSWSDGDWNCDGDFGSGDLVVAFQAGTYSRAARKR